MSVAKRVGWALLGEWWCVPVEMTDEEKRDALRDMNPLPPIPLPLVEDRCFGGFTCGDDATRRHVALDTGAYTYTQPDLNGPTEPEWRQARWRELIEASKNSGPFVGGGLFCADAPAGEKP